MYQVSTLQALMLGYSRAVISVSELLSHGNIGLGTFTDVDGEMIVLDGECYRALENGDIVMAEPDRGVPFSTVCTMSASYPLEFDRMDCIDDLKTELNHIIDDNFALNSMHMVRIDGDFELVDARSESGYESVHVDLKTILEKTQKAFKFENVRGTLVCVYFPDYMDGINASGYVSNLSWCYRQARQAICRFIFVQILRQAICTINPVTVPDPRYAHRSHHSAFRYCIAQG